MIQSASTAECDCTLSGLIRRERLAGNAVVQRHFQYEHIFENIDRNPFGNGVVRQRFREGGGPPWTPVTRPDRRRGTSSGRILAKPPQLIHRI
jgi:hypothetical protein